MRLAKAFFAAAAMSAALWSTANAMSVTPVLIDLKPGGQEASGQIRVINTGTGELPVSVTAKVATLDANGEIATTDDGADDLMIFPPQAILKPGATQVIRLQWVGDPDLKQSKTFVVSVAQQPVAMPQGVSGIQLLYDFQVIVDVAPLEGDPSLAVIKTELVKDEKGARRAAVTVTDNSNVHGYLSGANLRLELEDASGNRVWSESYTPEELSGKMGIGLVQPHATRRFVLPFDLPAQGVKLSADISYEGRS